MKNKVRKHFDFDIPFPYISFSNKPTNTSLLCTLNVCGVGYYHRLEEDELRFSYDIDSVYYEGSNVLPVIRAFMGFNDAEIAQLHGAIMHHLEFLFKEEIASTHLPNVAA